MPHYIPHKASSIEKKWDSLFFLIFLKIFKNFLVDNHIRGPHRLERSHLYCFVHNYCHLHNSWVMWSGPVSFCACWYWQILMHFLFTNPTLSFHLGYRKSRFCSFVLNGSNCFKTFVFPQKTHFNLVSQITQSFIAKEDEIFEARDLLGISTYSQIWVFFYETGIFLFFATAGRANRFDTLCTKSI